MFNRRTLSIIKRELREKVLSKTFVTMTLLIPLLFFGLIMFQMYLMNYDSNTTASLEIISESEQITAAAQNEFRRIPLVESGSYKMSYSTMSKDNFKSMLPSLQKDLLDEKLTGVIYIPNSAVDDKKIDYYSKNPNNNSLFDKIKSSINKVLVDIHFAGKQLSDKEISYTTQTVDFKGFRITSSKNIKAEGEGNQALSLIFTFLLYLSLLFSGTMIMRSVIQEKNNKIVEVLLSSVDSKELMTGKILGAGITGIAQMAVWLSPLILVISTSWFVLPKDYAIDISLFQVFYVLLNFFIGLITFLGLFASVGAIFDNDQDAQSSIWPVMMLIFIPFYIGISMQNNPEGMIGIVASMFPFAAIVVMPARMALVDIPSWQFILAIVVNVATMIAIFPLAGKIYRVGILMSGKKPKWNEVIRWLKYKY
ncbi:MAG: ABC transporter permease [Ignavibacteriaceae bacterium]